MRKFYQAAIMVTSILWMIHCQVIGENTKADDENGHGDEMVRTEALIIDHNHTEISRIPGNWLEAVKTNSIVHYAHTSHGEQIVAGLHQLAGVGMQIWRAVTSPYAFYHAFCSIPVGSGIRMMDGQQMDYCETYVTPELYWQGNDGMRITRHVLNQYQVTISLWAWCSQLDDYSESEVNDYLQAMAKLEEEFPGVVFIYMTGNAQSASETRVLNNNRIREYCRNNHKVCFDFADLDCWYNGEQYVQDGIPMEHPRYHGDEAGHTTFESCRNKAAAFWYLLARLAGWEG